MTLGPNLSVTNPEIGASMPPSSLPIADGTDAAARLKFNVVEMGLSSAENP